MDKDRLREIRDYIQKLDSEVYEFIKSRPSAEELCAVLYEFNMAKRDLSSTYEVISIAVGKEIDGQIQMGDGATIEKRISYDRRGWQHRDLASAVAQKLTQMSIDMDTGEVIKTPEQIAEQVLDYVQPSYWRVKELSNIGINADNYCETGQAKTSIIVRKGNENE
jgi:hypothetical protein